MLYFRVHNLDLYFNHSRRACALGEGLLRAVEAHAIAFRFTLFEEFDHAAQPRAIPFEPDLLFGLCFLFLWDLEFSDLAIIQLISLDDFPHYSVVGNAFLSEPRMCFDFLERDPIDSLESEEFHDEVLEGWRELVALDGFPVLLHVSGQEHFVVWVGGQGLVEGIYSLSQDEDYHAHGENVDLFTMVSAPQLHLGSHVGFGAPVGNQLVDIVLSGEPKICKLNCQIFGDENVLHL